MTIILNDHERAVCKDLILQDSIHNIFKDRELAWTEMLETGSKYVLELRDSEGKLIDWTDREILFWIADSISGSQLEEELFNQIENLNLDGDIEREPIYKDLSELEIPIGKQALKLRAKIIFIIFGYLCELNSIELN